MNYIRFTYRSIFVFIPALVILFSVGLRITWAAEIAAPGPDFSVDRLDSGVYVVSHTLAYSSNSLIVVMADSSLVLVNTVTTTAATNALLQWMRGTFGQRNITAINPHFHEDGTGGNAALKAAGIPIYGTDLTVKLLSKLDSTAVPPDHVFPLDSGIFLVFGGDTVRCVYPGPTHTKDFIVIWFPRQQVMFGGCVIKVGDQIGNTADADLKAWPESMQKLKPFPMKWLIPGHGNRFTPDLLDNTLRILKK